MARSAACSSTRPRSRPARGPGLRDRGKRVVGAADAVATELQTVLDRDDARARVRLCVARHDRARTRVAGPVNWSPVSRARTGP